MKRIKLLIIASLLITLTSNAQITKGNWMIGGSGSINSYESNYYNYNLNKNITDKGFGIQILPNLGYFIFNKFSAGLVLNYSFNQNKDNNEDSVIAINRYANVGPFARYYFLNDEKMVNVFLQVSYDTTLYNELTKTTRIAAKTGTVIFLNDIVGLEISLEYSKSKFKYSDPIYDKDNTTRNIQLGIGFQIHLERK